MSHYVVNRLYDFFLGLHEPFVHALYEWEISTASRRECVASVSKEFCPCANLICRIFRKPRNAPGAVPRLCVQTI